MASSKTVPVYRIFITFTACFYGVCLAQICTSGWFGNTCQHQCHCADGGGCGKGTGVCNSGGCDPDWFGPGCQYDVSEFTVSEAPGSDLSWLTDNNDQTCNDGQIESVTVSLVTPHPLTWIRVVISDEASLDQYQLSYQTVDSQSSTPCPDARSARVNDKTLDISCPTSQVVSHVTLSGNIVKRLCSLYISGGRNVALKQTTEQSSRHESRFASLAVDGDTGGSSAQGFRQTACTHTGVSSTDGSGWWRLTFSRAVKINRFLIYNRLDCCKESLSSFLLQVSSSSSGSGQVYTYTAPGEPYQDVYTVVPSPAIADSVGSLRIQEGYSRSIILTLCEVYAFGDVACPSGQFGRRCERNCNCAAVEEACFVSTGGCPSGCAPGFTGEDCYTPCPSGTYGSGCDGTCSVYCRGDGDPCSRFDGSCTQGCDPGYQGDLCDTQCNSGTYGLDCAQTCSVNCRGDGDPCNHVDGRCTNGCDPGYQGDQCNTQCNPGTYGLGCAQTCSENCGGDGDPCNHVDGSCTNGCDPGYQGDQCNTRCDSGTYGLDCAQTCSENCRGDGDPCNHVDGTCTNGCDPGYQGDQCNTQCDPGTYGLDCLQTCSENCRGNRDPCDHVDGTCTLGCDPGYKGDKCNTQCDTGTYGLDCAQRCSENCKGAGDPCHHVHGACTQRCDPGYQEDMCNAKCETGKYGQECRHTCSVHCAGEPDTCHHVDGTCNQGCDANYLRPLCTIRECSTSTFGPDCLQNCSVNCAGPENACDDVYGFCEFGCDPGYQTVQCDSECEPGKYGEDCKETCSEHCYGGPTTCHHVDGACYQGCEDRYQRPLCKAEYETDGSGENTWAIVGGVVAAFVVFDLAAIAIMCYIRRRRQMLSNTLQTSCDRESVGHVAVSSQPRPPTDDQAAGTQHYSEVTNAVPVDHVYEPCGDHYDTPDDFPRRSALHVDESNASPDQTAN